MAHTIVIFGASGDLTSRKLVPALYRMFAKNRLPESSRIVGVSRSQFEHQQWRESLRTSTEKFVGKFFDAETWAAFSENIFYHPGDIKTPADFTSLATFLDSIESDNSAGRVYYLSTMPQLYEEAIQQLGKAGLADDTNGYRRVIIEKPFGTDLATAQALNHSIHGVFREDQIYRIDHYLGKETVQNIFALRFANSIFEPIWNRNYVDHVQITVAEEVEIGRRAGYYDTSGILRDMFQNHLLQLMMITAMEPPARYDSALVRDEKVKVLHSIRKMTGGDFASNTVRGQYDGYLKEEGVPANSPTETFAVLKLYCDNWRWKDVPFFLRSGKGMSCRTTQIVIQFKNVPHMLFGGKTRAPVGNRLVMQVQPAEGIQLHFETKVPDSEMKTRTSTLDFSFNQASGGELPDAYQRLLMDAIQGDASLFARSDEVELAWGIIDPIISAWRSPAAPPLHSYETGLWGPTESTQWMEDQKREWFDVCPVLK
ncbi:Glucose-6-phosphate 1-dehydrogenase [Rubripirellula lacrimiformis]|uniref:Glucose-6-phosphate 1-dehydrogenase n=1 Tax=Rubripirellula lacrimiformis TaxID=1930273 RepID=A0A517NGU4_9BACT|nr:glucose-6-phosphate dehydrogenase [Rubripirellula lacrimiformis]QDT06356.1 Glucose-6-phosphate 1-dehydrogenase [Rubripirellula lacrimiformis]